MFAAIDRRRTRRYVNKYLPDQSIRLEKVHSPSGNLCWRATVDGTSRSCLYLTRLNAVRDAAWKAKIVVREETL